jgi:hypothetical protein
MPVKLQTFASLVIKNPTHRWVKLYFTSKPALANVTAAATDDAPGMLPLREGCYTKTGFG